VEFDIIATIKDWKGPVAIKVFYQDFVGILPNVDSKLRENALDELAKVAVMDHENIVRLLGMVQDSKSNNWAKQSFVKVFRNSVSHLFLHACLNFRNSVSGI